MGSPRDRLIKHANRSDIHAPVRVVLVAIGLGLSALNSPHGFAQSAPGQESEDAPDIRSAPTSVDGPTGETGDNGRSNKTPTPNRPGLQIIVEPEAPIIPLPIVLQINRGEPLDAVVFQDAAGQLYASADDWQRWNLKPLTTGVALINDEPYFPLAGVRGAQIAFDPQQQSAQIQFPSSAFIEARLVSRVYKRPIPERAPSLGGFFNYDLVGTRVAPDTGDSRDRLNGRFEIGAFNGFGVVTSRWLALELAGDAIDQELRQPPDRTVRLDTTARADFPDRLLSISIGDTIGGSGLFGRPVRLGGIRVARNFSTQPGFITVPRPSIRGETSLPSVLEVYVDGALRQRDTISPGEFLVDEIPIVTGQGNLEIRVTDLLGRETILNESYFTSSEQLKPGLRDFSYEAGYLREDFGRASDRYGPFVAIGTERYGFSDWATGELRVEAQSGGHQTLGGGAVLSLAPAGVFTVGLAGSRSNGETGALGLFAWQRSARRWLNLGLRAQFSSPNFMQAGQATRTNQTLQFSGLGRIPQRSIAATAGVFLGRGRSLGLSLIDVQRRNPDTRFSTLNMSFSAPIRRATAALRVSQRLEPNNDLSIAATLSWPFGTSGVRSYSGLRQDTFSGGRRSNQVFARLQKNVPVGEGWGFRAGVAHRDSSTGQTATTAQLGGTVRGRFGRYDAEVLTQESQNQYRAQMAGGFGFLGGRLFATRELTRSFALVDTGRSNVAIRVNNRPVGKTNRRGFAVLPDLQPYQANRVRLDDAALPLNVAAESTETLVTPYFRSGVIAEFPVATLQGATVTLLTPTGEPVPPGAALRLNGATVTVPVANNGLVYLETAPSAGQASRLEARWNGRRCVADLYVPTMREDQFITDLGTLTCALTEPAENRP